MNKISYCVTNNTFNEINKQITKKQTDDLIDKWMDNIGSNIILYVHEDTKLIVTFDETGKFICACIGQYVSHETKYSHNYDVRKYLKNMKQKKIIERVKWQAEHFDLIYANSRNWVGC